MPWTQEAFSLPKIWPLFFQPECCPRRLSANLLGGWSTGGEKEESKQNQAHRPPCNMAWGTHALPLYHRAPVHPQHQCKWWSSCSQTRVVSPGNRAERVCLFTTMEKSGTHSWKRLLLGNAHLPSESDGSKSFPLTLLRTMTDSCSIHCVCWHFHFCCFLRLPCLFMFGNWPVPLLPATHSPLHILLLL